MSCWPTAKNPHGQNVRFEWMRYDFVVNGQHQGVVGVSMSLFYKRQVIGETTCYFGLISLVSSLLVENCTTLKAQHLHTTFKITIMMALGIVKYQGGAPIGTHLNSPYIWMGSVDIEA